MPWMGILGVGVYLLAKTVSASEAVRHVDLLLTAPTARTPAKMRRRLARCRSMLRRTKRDPRVVEIARATVREAKGLVERAVRNGDAAIDRAIEIPDQEATP